MHAEIARFLPALTALCRAHGVARLEVFGSAGRGADFDLAGSDVDFLVTCDDANRNIFGALLDFQEALERSLGRPVDALEREAVEASRNYIRRRRILAEAESVYG